MGLRERFEGLWKREGAGGRTVAPNPITRAILAALLLSSVAGVVTLVLAVGQWQNTSTPFHVMLLGSVPIALIATLMATSYEERLWSARAVGPLLAALGVSFAWGGVMALSWREASVRQAALELASENEASSILERAMQGEDQVRAVQACRRLVSSRSEQDRQLAFEGLLRAPQLFKGCLEGADGASMERQMSWGRRLVDRWTEQMVVSEEVAQACRISEQLGDAGEEVHGASSALLACAIGEDRQELARCCSRSLSERGGLKGEGLAQIIDLERDRLFETRMATGLMRAEAGSADEQVLSQLGYGESASLQAYAYEASCRAMRLEATDLARAFSDVNAQRCKINNVALRQDSPYWIATCQMFMEARRSSPDERAQKLFCRITRAQMMARAANEASAHVHRATNSRYSREGSTLRDMARTINRAAQTSGFQGDDSTGIVQEYENTPYSSGDRRALHTLGSQQFERGMKVKTREQVETEREHKEALKMQVDSTPRSHAETKRIEEELLNALQ